MKSYEPTSRGLVPTKEGTVIFIDDLFVIGPDGKRHPTQQEISNFMGGIDYGQDEDRAVLDMLRRLATVAPTGKE